MTMRGSKQRRSNLTCSLVFHPYKRPPEGAQTQTKVQRRLCPSSVLKNLTKFQSWTSLLSVGNINARVS